MFWKRKDPAEKALEKKIKENVKAVDGRLWGYMVSNSGIIVDDLIRMRYVTHAKNDDTATYIRVFDPQKAEAKELMVTEYADLDNHHDVIKHECCAFVDGDGNLSYKAV